MKTLEPGKFYNDEWGHYILCRGREGSKFNIVTFGEDPAGVPVSVGLTIDESNSYLYNLIVDPLTLMRLRERAKAIGVLPK